jgi:DNA mismatch repair protein MutS
VQEKPDAGNPLLTALEDIDPDALTPRQALDALYRLKAILGQQHS